MGTGMRWRVWVEVFRVAVGGVVLCLVGRERAVVAVL